MGDAVTHHNHESAGLTVHLSRRQWAKIPQPLRKAVLAAQSAVRVPCTAADMCDALHNRGERELALDLLEAVNVCIREVAEEVIAEQWYQ